MCVCVYMYAYLFVCGKVGGVGDWGKDQCNSLT